MKYTYPGNSHIKTHRQKKDRYDTNTLDRCNNHSVIEQVSVPTYLKTNTYKVIVKGKYLLDVR